MTAAAQRNGTLNLQLKRKPFFLYPGGRHAVSKWGDRLDALYPGGRMSIAQLGECAGFSFDFDVDISDTMDSHRLYLWAYNHSREQGEQLAQAVGHQYFERRRPLADREMLCSCASEVGLDQAAARNYLESEGGYDEVKASVDANVRLGIHSIPVFIFRSAGYETVVHGSADVARFGEVLDAIVASSSTDKDEL